VASSTRAFRTAACLAGIVLVAFCDWLVLDTDSAGLTHVVTDTAYVLGPGFACAACCWAARSRPVERSGWTWLAASCGMWAAAGVVWTFYEFVLHRLAPSPSWADVGFIGYSVPAVIGLTLLSGSTRGGARRRLWLDALVTSLSVFLIGYLLVLGPVIQSLSRDRWLLQFESLAYPVGDISLASVVLVQALRAGTGRRGPWLLLAGGFLCMVATDIVYVREAAVAAFQVGGLLDGGWVAAFLLVGLAALAPHALEEELGRSRVSLLQESLPFVPVAFAIVGFVMVGPPLNLREPSVWLGAALLLAVAWRYLVTVKEHLDLATSLESKVTERTAELEHQAFHDSLTGLHNRDAFLRELHRRLGMKPTTPTSVLFIDLDGFKAVNDGLGHTAGDELLRAVARRFARALRRGDLVARLGGDEFGIITMEVDPGALATLAKRMLDTLAGPLVLNERSFKIAASIGIATARSRTSAEDVLRDADLAMYEAKSVGGATFKQASGTTHTASLQRLELEGDLSTALTRGQLELHYQPIARLASGEFAGAEALLRWRHPRLGLLTPDRFLDIAEQTGAIIEIGDWVIQQACRELRRWQAVHSGQKPLGVAVNLSGRQLTPRLVVSVRVALRANGLDPGCLTLELTEGLIQADSSLVGETVQGLRELGVWLAIDDFGTGHSSMARLRAYAFDELKIDRSFVSDLGSGDATFVTAQIALAHALGMQVVAEGVETEAQLNALVEHGCQQAQGYLLSKPLPAEQVRKLFLGAARSDALTPLLALP
jgi:diguanylate cyclase (GGDEF)-like protein